MCLRKGNKVSSRDAKQGWICANLVFSPEDAIIKKEGIGPAAKGAPIPFFEGDWKDLSVPSRTGFLMQSQIPALLLRPGRFHIFQVQ